MEVSSTGTMGWLWARAYQASAGLTNLDESGRYIDSNDRRPAIGWLGDSIWHTSIHVYNACYLYTLARTMRTNIVIDDALMKDALKATGLKTKREAVELGLQTLVRLNRQANIRKFRGKLPWDGNLRDSRSLGR
jgi:Arc/MetJ family transcription regulator